MSSASPPSYCPVGLDLVDAGAELDARVYYLGPVARNKVIRALELARASKVPSHVLAENITVASIVADLQMDCETVCAAVLRTVVDVDDEVETVNATNASTVTDADNRAHKLGHNNYSQGCSAAEVEHACGADVVKILRLHAQLEESVRLCVDASFTELSFANLRELILVRAVEEHRAISLELARAVLAIRTVDALSDPKARLAVARRTMHLYAPLANQLGIWYVQSELEELAFMYLDPASFEMIRHLVGERRRECEDMLTDSKQLLERILSATPEIRKLVRTVRIKGRVKGLYSVYRKMRRTGKKVYEIYDLLALRVVVQPKKADDDAERAACYAVAQVIQQHYDTFQSRAKDYIAQPKRNGYRSVHMTVLPHGGSTPLEIQIRSEKMHHVAEFGAAAHWIYKESSNDENSADDNEDGKDDDLLEVDVDQQTGINVDNDEELGAAYLDSDDDQSDSDSLYDYYYGYGAQLQSSDETVGAGPDLASDIDSDSDIEGANDKRTTQAAPAIAAFSPRDIRGNAGLMSPSSHDRPSDVDTCTTKAMRESHDATIKSSVVIDDDDDDDNDNNNLSNGNHRNRHSSTSSSSSTSTPTVHVNGGRSVRDATAKVKHTVINTSSSSYDQKTGKKKSKKSIKSRAHYAKDDGDNNSNTVTTKTATASTVVTTTKTATSTTGAKLRRRQSSRSTVSSYPRPRVAVKPQVVDPEAQRAHERLRALARQQQTVRGVAAQDMLQHELRGGYVTCLASAIRASRVIVATAGQLYGLAVGSTLMDLASRLGVATLGAIAVVNGQIVPLTQRLNMNDIVQFITL